MIMAEQVKEGPFSNLSLHRIEESEPPIVTGMRRILIMTNDIPEMDGDE